MRTDNFNKIPKNPNYPLFSQIILNIFKITSRRPNEYYPKQFRTAKDQKSFFPFLWDILITINYFYNFIVNNFMLMFSVLKSVILILFCCHLMLFDYISFVIKLFALFYMQKMIAGFQK